MRSDTALRAARKRLLSSLGLNADDASAWAKKLKTLRGNCTKEPYDCLLTFDQYVALAADAKLTCPTQIGRQPTSYQMARFGDKGNYEVGNCRFITQTDNVRERCLNGGTRRMVEKKTGRTKLDHPGIASQARKLSKSFTLVHESGEIVHGTNASEFARSRGFPPASITALLAGKRARYKGWAGCYTIERSEE